MIRIELLPAAFGDCILVEYGKSGAEARRILVDAGVRATYASSLLPRLAELNRGRPVALELLVVTHIDRDHIGGVLPLLQDAPRMITPKDTWFNGRHHLDLDALGAKEAEALGALLHKKGFPWNRAFSSDATKAVVVPEVGPLPRIELGGGAAITLLSPYPWNLEELATKWDDTLGSWDTKPDDEEAVPRNDDLLGKRSALTSITVAEMRQFSEASFQEDDTAPNGSSIAFLFEYESKRVLLGADARPSVLLRSLERFSDNVVELDAFKMSHHGSMSNISAALLAKIKCSRFLVSTSGASFGHPHPEAIARVVCSGRGPKDICFNYATEYTTVWDDPTATAALGYRALYPKPGEAGFVLEL
jgi:hypothetical protein